MQKSNYVLGLTYVGITALLWGFLPILMKVALQEFSGGSIVWFRFTFAFAALFFYLKFRNKQPATALQSPPRLGILAGIFIAGNYFYFLSGLDASSPSNAGVLIQIAPVILVFMGVVLFKERLNRRQVLGLAIAVVGFFLFYKDQSRQLGSGVYSEASLYMIISAVLWAGYMVCQKKLSVSFEAHHVNVLVYGTAALVLVPTVTWAEFNNPNFWSWVLMVFLGVNTLLAYGCLAEAVNHIPLWLISVVITLNPFITIVVMQVLPLVAPNWVAPETIGLWGYIGACTAISGVALVLRRD